MVDVNDVQGFDAAEDLYNEQYTDDLVFLQGFDEDFSPQDIQGFEDDPNFEDFDPDEQLAPCYES